MSKASSAKDAFEEGDYRTARTLAQATLKDADATAKARDRAREVLHKTSAPTPAKYIFLLAALLLLLLSVFWIGEGKRHHNDNPAPPPPAAAPT